MYMGGRAHPLAGKGQAVGWYQSAGRRWERNQPTPDSFICEGFYTRSFNLDEKAWDVNPGLHSIHQEIGTPKSLRSGNREEAGLGCEPESACSFCTTCLAIREEGVSWKPNSLWKEWDLTVLEKQWSFPRRAGYTYILGINNAILQVLRVPNGMTLIRALSLCKRLNLEILTATLQSFALRSPPHTGFALFSSPFLNQRGYFKSPHASFPIFSHQDLQDWVTHKTPRF